MAARAASSAVNHEAGHETEHPKEPVDAPPCQVPGTVLGYVPMAGDGNCLFHALGYLDGRDGAALRNEVAAFMVDQACNQRGFEEAWLEEADELLQGTWGGHTAMTAYSLMKHVRLEIHTPEANGTASVTDASHADVASDINAPLRRVLYSKGSHYDALVELLPNPQGWAPAWVQPLPAVYFKEEEKPDPKAEGFPSLDQAARSSNRKGPRFTKPRPAGKQAGKGKGKTPLGEEDAGPKKTPAIPAQYPVQRRCVTKTTPPPELRNDILTELCKIPVKPRMAHPHQKQENLIKATGFKMCCLRGFHCFNSLCMVRAMHAACCTCSVRRLRLGAGDQAAP